MWLEDHPITFLVPPIADILEMETSIESVTTCATSDRLDLFLERQLTNVPPLEQAHNYGDGRRSYAGDTLLCDMVSNAIRYDL